MTDTPDSGELAAPEGADAPETETTASPEAPKPEGAEKPADGDGKPAKKPWYEGRIATLTAKNHAAEERAAKAERELEMLRALAEKPKEGDAKPDPKAPLSQAELDRLIDAKAEAKAAQREYQNAVDTWARNGRAEVPNFDAQCNLIASLGAGERPEFMQALVAIPDGHKLIGELAEDPDEATRIINLPPVRMAAELGRMAAKLGTAKKPQSKAPAPIKTVDGHARREPSLDDPDLPTKDWIRLRQEQVEKAHKR